MRVANSIISRHRHDIHDTSERERKKKNKGDVYGCVGVKHVKN